MNIFIYGYFLSYWFFRLLCGVLSYLCELHYLIFGGLGVPFSDIPYDCTFVRRSTVPFGALCPYQCVPYAWPYFCMPFYRTSTCRTTVYLRVVTFACCITVYLRVVTFACCITVYLRVVTFGVPYNRIFACRYLWCAVWPYICVSLPLVCRMAIYLRVVTFGVPYGHIFACRYLCVPYDHIFACRYLWCAVWPYICVSLPLRAVWPYICVSLPLVCRMTIYLRVVTFACRMTIYLRVVTFGVPYDRIFACRYLCVLYNRIFACRYLCVLYPADLNISIHSDADGHPYADYHRQEEEGIPDVGEEESVRVLARYIRLYHLDAVRQIEKHQHANIRYRLRNEVISGGGSHGLPVPDKQGKRVSNEADDEENGSEDRAWGPVHFLGHGHYVRHVIHDLWPCLVLVVRHYGHRRADDVGHYRTCGVCVVHVSLQQICKIFEDIKLFVNNTYRGFTYVKLFAREVFELINRKLLKSFTLCTNLQITNILSCLYHEMHITCRMTKTNLIKTHLIYSICAAIDQEVMLDVVTAFRHFEPRISRFLYFVLP